MPSLDGVPRGVVVDVGDIARAVGCSPPESIVRGARSRDGAVIGGPKPRGDDRGGGEVRGLGGGSRGEDGADATTDDRPRARGDGVYCFLPASLGFFDTSSAGGWGRSKSIDRDEESVESLRIHEQSRPR